MPGRLLLLRLESTPATYVVCTYQFVWNEPPSAEACIAERESFWTCLASTIRGVPWRAQLVVTGDMNTPCSQHLPLVGPGITPLRGEARQLDAPRFQQLLSQFGLAVLNSWGRQKHSHTYQFEAGTCVHRTQIDYIITRARDADPLAKSARPRQRGQRYEAFPAPNNAPPAFPFQCPAQEVNRTLQSDPHQPVFSSSWRLFCRLVIRESRPQCSIVSYFKLDTSSSHPRRLLPLA